MTIWPSLWDFLPPRDQALLLAQNQLLTSKVLQAYHHISNRRQSKQAVTTCHLALVKTTVQTA